MALLLKTTRFVESQIDTFLDVVSDSALLFQLGMEDYQHGRTLAIRRVQPLDDPSRRDENLQPHPQKDQRYGCQHHPSRYQNTLASQQLLVVANHETRYLGGSSAGASFVTDSAAG